MTADEELHDLANRYVEGRAATEDLAALERAIRDDPAFRRWFVRLLHLDAALAGQPGIAAPLLRPSADSGSIWLAAQTRTTTLGWWGRAGATAAAALLLIVIGAWLPLDRAGVVPTPPVHLVASTNAQWSDPEVELSLRAGDIPAGALRLDSGSAEFRFRHGATAIVLGPAEVRFTGPDAMFVQNGQVLCRCPTERSRITLTTPTTQVIDLGTEFAVAVAPDAGATRVAVISGAVQVGSATPTVLRTGESAEVDRARVLTLTPLPQATFAALLSVAADSRVTSTGPNLLQDPSFSGQPAGAWRLSEGHAEFLAKHAILAISARAHRFWPSARQTVRQQELAGRLICTSIVACSAPDDPLQERQTAILKLVFIDERGREFAQSSRHFLATGSAHAGEWVNAQVATYAPPGTQRVEVQLLLNARGRTGGAVWFREPVLWCGPAVVTP
jgi:hypothetical protein